MTESLPRDVVARTGCLVSDDNYQRYSNPHTTRVRVAGLNQLILITPTGQPPYWLLEIPWLGAGKSISLGEVAHLLPSAAKQLARRLLKGPTRSPDDGLTLKQFLWLYKRIHVVRLAKSSQMTIRSYSKRLMEAFGNEPLLWINGAAVREWHAQYSRKSPGAADEAKALLRAVLNCAKDWDLLPHDHPNPCSGIRRNKRNKPHQSLGPEQLQALGAELKRDESSMNYRTHARRTLLMLYVGARPGEIRTLRWENVIFADGVPSHIQLHRSKVGPRRIDLSQQACQILLTQKFATGGSYGAVFPLTPRSRKPYSEDQAKNYWTRLSKQAGLPKEARQYWLRHTLGTNSLLAGGSLATTGAILGHKRPSTTQRYLHVPSGYVIAAGIRIGRRISAWMGLPANAAAAPKERVRLQLPGVEDIIIPCWCSYCMPKPSRPAAPA